MSRWNLNWSHQSGINSSCTYSELFSPAAKLNLVWKWRSQSFHRHQTGWIVGKCEWIKAETHGNIMEEQNTLCCRGYCRSETRSLWTDLVTTFIDLPHDGELQVLPVVLFAVDPHQDSAQLRRQPKRRHHVDVAERAQSAWKLLHRRDTLLRVLKTQHVNHWGGGADRRPNQWTCSNTSWGQDSFSSAAGGSPCFLYRYHGYNWCCWLQLLTWLLLIGRYQIKSRLLFLKIQLIWIQ